VGRSIHQFFDIQSSAEVEWNAKDKQGSLLKRQTAIVGFLVTYKWPKPFSIPVIASVLALGLLYAGDQVSGA
jgi:hypothetical protein